MKNLALAAAVTLLAACAIPQGGMKGGVGVPRYSGIQPKYPPALSKEHVDEVIDIFTEPAGARIHVNDSLVGYSPVRYMVRRFWRGAPGNMVLDLVKIEALPTAGGQCVQTGYYGEGARKVSTPVNFTMTDCAPAQPAGKK